MEHARCNAHCRGCDRCFTGTSAFDRHRSGPFEARECLDPDGVKKLYAHDGSCDVSEAEQRDGVIVWSTVE